MMLLRLVYAANVLVAGTVGALSFFAPARAAISVWTSAAAPDHAMRVVGALWLAIAAVSAIGLATPRPMAAVLLVQLLYKGGWLLGVAAPALLRGDGDRLPWGLTLFFALWVVVLPFAIPWREWFAR